MGKTSDIKRKKQENEGNVEARSTNYRKSSKPMANSSQLCHFSDEDEKDEKKKAKLMKNRVSAQHSRDGKKLYVEELE